VKRLQCCGADVDETGKEAIDDAGATCLLSVGLLLQGLTDQTREGLSIVIYIRDATRHSKQQPLKQLGGAAGAMDRRPAAGSVNNRVTISSIHHGR